MLRCCRRFSHSARSAGPLSHLRVLDLSRVVAGPTATQTFADLGAEVIKVERRQHGDDTRGWGPPFVHDAQGERAVSAYFLTANRSKKSLALDIATESGQEILRAIAAKSDVLVENFKVGGLAKYGLGYEDLKKIKCVSRSRSRDLWLVNLLAFLPLCSPLPPLTQTSPDRYPPPQSGPRLLLDHRLRPDRAARPARRLRLSRPGHGWAHVGHG